MSHFGSKLVRNIGARGPALLFIFFMAYGTSFSIIEVASLLVMSFRKERSRTMGGLPHGLLSLIIRHFSRMFIVLSCEIVSSPLNCNKLVRVDNNIYPTIICHECASTSAKYK